MTKDTRSFAARCALPLAILAAILMRIFVLSSPSTFSTLLSRFELSTPASGFRRRKKHKYSLFPIHIMLLIVVEGIVLHEKYGLSSYSGSASHHPPLMIRMFGKLVSSMDNLEVFGRDSFDVAPWNQARCVCIAFILFDVTIALMLHRVAQWVQSMTATENARLGLRESASANMWFPDIVAGLYLLNPINLISCGALSTDIVSSFFIVSALFGLSLGSALLSAVSLAAAVYIGLYPAPLLIPVCIILYNKPGKVSGAKAVVIEILLFVAALAGLVWASWAIEGHSFEWARGVYGFLLTVPDRTPNIGVWWYLFLELFTFYEPFFIAIFQINIFIATAVPLSVRFSSHPLIVYWTMCVLISIFSPYPSLANIGLHFGLLPLVWNKVKKCGYTLLLAITAAVLVVILPNATHSWLYLGTGNVNFYYFGTLVLQIVQVNFLSDCLSKVIIRDFLIKRKIGEFAYLNDPKNSEEIKKQQ